MRPIHEVATPADAALDAMTREQLHKVVDLVAITGGNPVPAVARASDDALRSAIRTNVRIGRLTEQQIIDVAAKSNVQPLSS